MAPVETSDPRPTDARRNRRQRQRAEIAELLAGGDVQRATDLAHEHLAEFPDDDGLRAAVVKALRADADPRVRRRVDELPGPQLPLPGTRR
jgi:hypothetical protein